MRQGDWKLRVDAGQVFLFNLTEDIGERNDRAKERSDLVARMHKLVAEWETDVDTEAKAK